jgi:multiple sugar transport system ATP-binding protein
LRPEHITRASGVPSSDGAARLEVAIELVQPTGARTYATFRLGAAAVMAELQAHDVSRPGETIAVDINLQRAVVFDAATEKAI